MDNTMRLDGGIDEYGFDLEFKRHKDGDPPKGRKVKFLNSNGWEYELKEAKELFAEGQILTVKEIYVGRSSSTVEFFEHPGKRFNTVMFTDVE